jgi:homoserine O-succinyltransferase
MALRSGCDAQTAGGDRLQIALVNIMPDAALLETQRQFTSLIGKAAAASGVPVHITLYCLDSAVRPEPGSAALRQFYRPLAALLDRGGIDAVVVTGTAPRQAALQDEEVWPHLARLFDWAADHAGSLLVSCLAAHAAVAHIDGIARRRLPQKCCGVFSVTAADPHPLLAGAPDHWRTPHSRYHAVDESALRSAGYAILGRSEAIGVDAFAREVSGMLLLGLHGHPEYAANTLLREYRRDVAHSLSGRSSTYPELPQALVEPSSEQHLRVFRERVARGQATSMEDFPKTLAIRADARAGRDGGAQLFAGWLLAVQQRRPRSGRSRPVIPVPCLVAAAR